MSIDLNACLVIRHVVFGSVMRGRHGATCATSQLACSCIDMARILIRIGHNSKVTVMEASTAISALSTNVCWVVLCSHAATQASSSRTWLC